MTKLALGLSDHTRELARLRRLLALPRLHFKRRLDEVRFEHAKFVCVTTTQTILIPALENELSVAASDALAKAGDSPENVDYYAEELGLQATAQEARFRLVSLGFYDKHLQRGLSATDGRGSAVPVLPLTETAVVLASIFLGVVDQNTVDAAARDDILAILKEPCRVGNVLSKLIELEASYDTTEGLPEDSDPRAEYFEFTAPNWSANIDTLSPLASESCYKRIVFRLAELSQANRPGSDLARRLLSPDRDRRAAYAARQGRNESTAVSRSALGDLPRSAFEEALFGFTHTIHRLGIVRARVLERVTLRHQGLQPLQYGRPAAASIKRAHLVREMDSGAIPQMLAFKIPNSTHVSTFRFELTPPQDCTVEYLVESGSYADSAAMARTMRRWGKLAIYTKTNKLSDDLEEIPGARAFEDLQLSAGIQLQRHGLARLAVFVLALLCVAISASLLDASEFFKGRGAGSFLLVLPAAATGLVVQGIRDPVAARFNSQVRTALYIVAGMGFAIAALAVVQPDTWVARLVTTFGLIGALYALLNLAAVGFAHRYRTFEEEDAQENPRPYRGTRMALALFEKLSGLDARRQPRDSYKTWTIKDLQEHELKIARTARWRFRFIALAIALAVWAIGLLTG